MHSPPGIPRTSAGLLSSAWLLQARLLGVLQLCCDATMSTASIKTPHLYSLVGNDVLPPSPGPKQHRLVRARHSLLVLTLQAAAAHQQYSQQITPTLGTCMGHSWASHVYFKCKLRHFGYHCRPQHSHGPWEARRPSEVRSSCNRSPASSPMLGGRT